MDLFFVLWIYSGKVIFSDSKWILNLKFFLFGTTFSLDFFELRKKHNKKKSLLFVILPNSVK